MFLNIPNIFSSIRSINQPFPSYSVFLAMHPQPHFDLSSFYSIFLQFGFRIFFNPTKFLSIQSTHSCSLSRLFLKFILHLTIPVYYSLLNSQMNSQLLPDIPSYGNFQISDQLVLDNSMNLHSCLMKSSRLLCFLTF